VSNSFFDGLLSGDVVLSLVEEKALGPKVGSQIGGGLRSAPKGMSFVDITGRIDGDNDGIVFEGIPGMERPIIPRFLVPTNLAGKLSKLIEGDSLEIERQRRAGNTNIEFDENKFNSIISSLKEESSRTREFVSPKRRKISERINDGSSSRSKRAFPPVSESGPKKRIKNEQGGWGRKLHSIDWFMEEGDDGEEYKVKKYFDSVTFVRDLDNLLTKKKKKEKRMGYDGREYEVPDVSDKIQVIRANMFRWGGLTGIPQDVLYATIVERYGEDSFDEIVGQLYGRKKNPEVQKEIILHTLKNLVYSLHFADQVLTEEDIKRGKRKITLNDMENLFRHVGYTSEILDIVGETAKALHFLKKYEESRPDVEVNPRLRVDLSDLRARLDKFKNFTIPRRFKLTNSLEGASFIDWTSPNDDEMNDSMSALLEAGERVLNQWKSEASKIPTGDLLEELELIKEKLTRLNSDGEDSENKRNESKKKILISAIRDAASYLSAQSQKDVEDIIKSFTFKDGYLVAKKSFAGKIADIIDREPMGEGVIRLSEAFRGRPEAESLRKIIELNNAGISKNPDGTGDIEEAKDYLIRYWRFRADGYAGSKMRKHEKSFDFAEIGSDGKLRIVWGRVTKDNMRDVELLNRFEGMQRIFFKRDDGSYYNPFNLDEKMLNEHVSLKDESLKTNTWKEITELEVRRSEINQKLAQYRVETLMNVLRATRPGYGESNQSFQEYFDKIIGGEGFTQDETREMVERIRSIFPEEWVAALLDSTPGMTIVWRKRGYFSESRRTPTVAIDYRGFTVLAHEIGHGVEELPGIKQAETIFFRKIGLDAGWTDATAEKVKINSTGTEMAYNYKLMGEGYKSKYTSRTYAHENFELLTMGIEALLVRGDALSKYDERYLNFLLGVLAGL
jgi:hypothetical protein